MTQDSYITDLPGFMQLITQHKPGEITGGKDTCADIVDYLKELGITMEDKRYSFVQGNFILACYHTWITYYTMLPKSVRHYCDDSIFSYLAEKTGGVILNFVAPVWRHHRTRNIYDLEALYA